MRRSRVLLALLTVCAVAACSKGAKKKGPFVAEGDGIAVTTEEFRKRLDDQSPFIRSRYSTLERKKEFLENLIRFEVLAKEAEKRGLDKDPEIRETLRKIMVQKLVRQAFDEAGGKPSDGDLHAFYDSHVQEFVKPERVRVQLIWVDAPKGAPDRAAKLEVAKKLLLRAKSEGARNPLAFSNVARDASQDVASKASGGDLGFRSREEFTSQYSSELADAAFALKQMGQETNVVETPAGFGILKLTSRQEPSNRSFDEVREQLVSRVGRERSTKAFDEQVKKLREGAEVKINDAELEKVVVAAQPPQGAMPGPGMPVPPPPPQGARP
jgi:peptidyl-prolyl cis-trans isomerase C